MNKSLETKLQKIKKQIYKPKDFIIADAKLKMEAMIPIEEFKKNHWKNCTKKFKKRHTLKKNSFLVV